MNIMLIANPRPATPHTPVWPSLNNSKQRMDALKCDMHMLAEAMPNEPKYKSLNLILKLILSSLSEGQSSH